MSRRQSKTKQPPPRTHEPAIETLIAVTQELLEMDRKSGDGVAFNPWDREGLHKRVKAAIAAVRAPVAATSKRLTVTEGRKLAVQLLNALEAASKSHLGEGDDSLPCWGLYCYDAYVSDHDPDQRLRDGPQVNIVRDYLSIDGGNQAVIDGFCSVLTDHLATWIAGVGTGDPRTYLRPPRELSDHAAEEVSA